MPTVNMPTIGSREPTNAQIANYIFGLERDMNYHLNNLDELNISRLDARVIVSESITTDKLAAAVITTDKIAAGAVIAEKIDVSELSAISANLGHITAGLIEAVEIYGSHIATAEESYPRIELSSDQNLLKAAQNSNDYVALVPDESGVPAYVVIDGGTIAFQLNYDPDQSRTNIQSYLPMFISSVGGMVIRNQFGDIELDSSGDVIIPFSRLVSTLGGDSLQAELNDIWDAIEDLEDRVSALEGP